MADKRRVYSEIGVLCGHRDPGWLAEFLAAPPCDHSVPWYFDDEEICPPPCGQKHEWCCRCHRPMKPACAALAELEAADD